MAGGRKKPFSERSLTSSRVRTGKKGRNTPRNRGKRTHAPAVRQQPTTGRIDFEWDNSTDTLVKKFTLIDS